MEQPRSAGLRGERIPKARIVPGATAMLRLAGDFDKVTEAGRSLANFGNCPAKQPEKSWAHPAIPRPSSY
jgi:hypothetical protein